MDEDAHSGRAPGEPRHAWLLLVYHVPTEPSRVRACVWRRLRGLGAVYVQHAAAAVPDEPANRRALRALRHEIEVMGGRAVLLTCTAVAGAQQILELYQQARTGEFEEIIIRSRELLSRLRAGEPATLEAQLPGYERELAALRARLCRVRAHDRFDAPGSELACAAFDACEAALTQRAADLDA